MSGSKEKSRSEILSANIKQYLKINGLKESEAADPALLTAFCMRAASAAHCLHIHLFVRAKAMISCFCIGAPDYCSTE